jgi:hypothetical protein
MAGRCACALERFGAQAWQSHEIASSRRAGFAMTPRERQLIYGVHYHTIKEPYGGSKR